MRNKCGRREGDLAFAFGGLTAAKRLQRELRTAEGR
jgi:hypothetical protein